VSQLFSESKSEVRDISALLRSTSLKYGIANQFFTDIWFQIVKFALMIISSSGIYSLYRVLL
jgi:hypothetical protein